MCVHHHSCDTQFLDSGLQEGVGKAHIGTEMTLVSHSHPLDAREFILCLLISMQLGLVFDAVPANSAEAKWDGC